MVGSWGQQRERLFRDDRDFQRFLLRLAEGVEEFGIRLYLFTLMSNHYHLVLETPGGNLSRFMQNLSTAYTVYFNKRHRRHGHLLDGRYKAKVVSGDEYLLKLTRYVHQNPVWVAGWKDRPIGDRIKQLRAYPWSSYAGYIGLRKGWEFVDEEPILAMMSGPKRARRSGYREFVETGLAEGDEEFQEALKASPTGIGDEEFRKWVESLRWKKLGQRKKAEDVSFRRVQEALSAEEVLQILAEVFGVPREEFEKRRRDSPLRAVAARYLIRYAGVTQREVARLLGVGTGGAVSAQLARLPELIRKDNSLRQRTERIEDRLEDKRAEIASGPIRR